MEKCICSGLNDDCFFCGGLGYYQPSEKTTTFNYTKSSNEKNKRILSKDKIKITPKEIILNHSKYSTKFLEKVRAIIKEYIKNYPVSETSIKIEKHKNYIAELEKIIFTRAQQEPKRKYKTKTAEIDKKSIGTKTKKKMKSEEKNTRKPIKKIKTTYEEKRNASKLKLINKILLNKKMENDAIKINELMNLKFGELNRRLKSK